MTSYRVRYHMDEAGYWVAVVQGVTGCHTQGRSLESARQRIREALAVCVDDADHGSLNESYHVPNKPALAVTRRAKSAKQRAEKAHNEAQALLREAVVQLLAANLSHRDAAVLLGISHQRVAQLAREAREHEPNRRRKGA